MSQISDVCAKDNEIEPLIDMSVKIKNELEVRLPVCVRKKGNCFGQ